MSKWTVLSRRVIDPDSTNKIRILLLDPLDRGKNDPHVFHVDAPIAIEVVHPPIVIAVDVDIGSISKLVTAVSGSAASVT